MTGGHRPNPNLRNPIGSAYITPKQPDEIEQKKVGAWQQQGVVCLRIDELQDDWLKARLIDFMTKFYGERG